MHAIPLRLHVLVNVFMCIFHLQQPFNFINGFISLLVIKSDNEFVVNDHSMICFNILSINNRKHLHYFSLYFYFLNLFFQTTNSCWISYNLKFKINRRSWSLSLFIMNPRIFKYDQGLVKILQVFYQGSKIQVNWPKSIVILLDQIYLSPFNQWYTTTPRVVRFNAYNVIQ
jgi:hypothetical protein